MEVKILLKETKEVPSPYVKGRVWGVVENRIQKINRISALIFSLTSTVSTTALVFVSIKVYQDLIASGILNYFSLMLSDWATVGTLWKEFSYAILESIPMMSVIPMLGIIFITMLSLKKSSVFFEQMNYSIR